MWQSHPMNRDAADAGAEGRRGEVATTRAGRDIGSSDRAVDGRLMLQLGMLVAAIYAAFLCVWFSATRGSLGLGDARDVRGGLRRLRAWTPALPTARGKSEHAVAPLLGGSSPADPRAVWTCAISWSPGRVRSRFRAMIAPPHGRRQWVVAQSKRLRWPPRRGDTSATAELVSALESLDATLVAAGWEPVESAGSWSARRFVWRGHGEPPTRL
jgi:hypothetical protein